MTGDAEADVDGVSCGGWASELEELRGREEEDVCVPVCMLTKQLHTLNAALSRSPVMKHIRINTASPHARVISSLKYDWVRFMRD